MGEKAIFLEKWVGSSGIVKCKPVLIRYRRPDKVPFNGRDFLPSQTTQRLAPHYSPHHRSGSMRFTDSPVIELSVAGTVFSFEQDNGSMHVGTSVWPCSLVLVKFVERWLTSPPSSPNPYSNLLDFPNKRAIELGSGCGPAGVGLAHLGLNILLTDIPPVMPALKRNIKRNKKFMAKAPKYGQLYWNDANRIRALGPPFDFVVAADVVYMEDSAVQLVDAMEALLAPDGVALLGYQLRSPEAHALFWEKCRRVFPFIEKVPHEHLHPDYAYEETDVYIIKKQA